MLKMAMAEEDAWRGTFFPMYTVNTFSDDVGLNVSTKQQAEVVAGFNTKGLCSKVRFVTVG